jgi:hypothetical protein
MKMSLIIAATLFACLPLSVLAADTDQKNNADSARTKALEAEIAALRAQLRAESQIRGEDRSREGDHRGTESNTDHDGGHEGDHGGDHDGGHDGGHTSQFEYVYELDGDLRDAPLGMIRSQLGGMPAGSTSMIIINGEEISLERFMKMSGQGQGHEDGHEGEHRHDSNRVMHLDPGGMDRVPGFLPELIMSQMDGHGGQPMMFRSNGGPMGPGGNHPFVVFGRTDERMHDAMMDEGHLEAIHLAVMETMAREYPDGQRMFDDVHDEMARHGGMDPFEAMELLIQRLEEQGQDPHPLIQLRDEIMHGMGGGGEHDDPFFHEGGEFVGKLQLSDEIATRLSDSKSVAILCIWEARQHLEPQERLDVLFPIMIDEDIEVNVRNAAAMVVRESYVELGDRVKALETLQMQIRLNGLRIPMN